MADDLAITILRPKFPGDVADDLILKLLSGSFPGKMNTQVVNIKTDVITLWCVACAIQRACSSRCYAGSDKKLAERFARKLFDQIAITPALKAAAELGWNPQSFYDE